MYEFLIKSFNKILWLSANPITREGKPKHILSQVFTPPDPIARSALDIIIAILSI